MVNENSIRELRKYHEIVCDESSEEPFGIKVCPNCGSDELGHSQITDYARDDIYFILSCKGRGWSTWAE